MSSKKTKVALSEKVGYWDNSQTQAEQQWVENARGEIERCFNSDHRIKKLKDQGKVIYTQVGSISRDTAITDKSDLDFHIVFKQDENTDFTEFKDYVEELLINYFDPNHEGIVKRNVIAILLKGHENRIDTDIVVGKYICDEQENPYNDKTQLEEPHYPKMDETNTKNLNSKNKSNFSKTVKMFKGLKREMKQMGVKDAGLINSFTIECVLYNLKTRIYNQERKTYSKIPENSVRNKEMFWRALTSSLAYLNCNSEKMDFEINGIKKLFADEKKRTNTKRFFEAVKKYVKENYKIS